MRFKDMRLYVFFSILLIAGFIALAFFYIFPLKENMRGTITTEASYIVSAKSEYVSTKIDTLEFEFLSGKERDNSFTVITDLKSNYRDYFQNDSCIITVETNIMESDLALSDKYSFFVYDETRERVGVLNTSLVFDNYNNDESYFLFSKEGIVFASNLNGATSNTFYNLIRQNESGIVDSLLAFTQGDGTGIYKKAMKLNGDDSSIAVVKFGDYYYGEIISTNGISLSMKAINEQAWIYFIGYLVILVLSFLIMLLGFKKSAKLVKIDQKNYKKAKAIVIRAKKNGEIVFINKSMKNYLGVDLKLTNLRQFSVEKYKSIVECYRKEMDFIASLSIDGHMKYFNLVSILSGNDYYIIGFDITKQYLNNQFLLSMSSKNPVTKLDNMLTLAGDYIDIVEEASEYLTTFVYINIINFRETNKVFSRKIGDSLLVALASIIKQVFAGMKIYHVDADRFIVVETGKGESPTEMLCNKLLTSLKAPIQIGNNHIYVTVKIGTYDLDLKSNPNISLDEIRSKLDIAMNKAKNTLNKHVIAYDSSLESFINETNRMEMALETAIKNQEFIMKFQPQYDIFKNRIVSFEALIRWNHPDYIKQSPQVFIELAEQNGYILDIGRFVIQSSFRAAKELEKYGCHVSINVSPAQIFQAGFVNDLVKEFEKNELSPGSIAIEITETFLMENFDIVIEKLKILKSKGFSIHLDDFGTGYSSMLYLKDLPVDTLKIDKEFTKSIEIDKFSLAMVKKICSMGTDLNLDIICEGVETQGQSNLLKQMGCHIIQGWLIGKAMALDEAIKAIEFYNGKATKTQSKK